MSGSVNDAPSPRTENRTQKKRGPLSPGLDENDRGQNRSVAIPTTATATTTTAAVFATTATTAARRTLFAWTGDINREGATANGSAIQGRNGFLRLFRRAHG